MKSIPVRHLDRKITAHRFTIRNLREIHNGEDLVQELHKHDFYFVLAVEHGRGVHEIDFVQYPIRDHSVFMLRPGQVHTLQLNGESNGFLMEFDLSFYQPKHTISLRRWKKAASKNYCAIERSAFAKLLAHLFDIYEEYSAKQDGYIEAIRANLDLFFIDYIRQSRNPDEIEKPENTYAQERFEELALLLEKNISRMKNVSQYADLLSLSSYQLNAITKEATGKTVSELISEQIILEAKRNLLATANQVKDIADQLGYEDVSYFSRFFKKHTGQTPEAFRRSFK